MKNPMKVITVAYLAILLTYAATLVHKPVRTPERGEEYGAGMIWAAFCTCVIPAIGGYMAGRDEQ